MALSYPVWLLFIEEELVLYLPDKRHTTENWHLKEKRKKSQYLAGYKPITSNPFGVCSTAVLLQLPSDKCNVLYLIWKSRGEIVSRFIVIKVKLADPIWLSKIFVVNVFYCCLWCCCCCCGCYCCLWCCCCWCYCCCCCWCYCPLIQIAAPLIFCPILLHFFATSSHFSYFHSFSCAWKSWFHFVLVFVFVCEKYRWRNFNRARFCQIFTLSKWCSKLLKSRKLQVLETLLKKGFCSWR